MPRDTALGTCTHHVVCFVRIRIDNDASNSQSLTSHFHSVQLTPDLSAFVFDGEVDVTLDVVSDTPTVVFHAYQLTVSKATVALHDGQVGQTHAFSMEQRIKQSIPLISSQ